jgi:hypothetical protein
VTGSDADANAGATTAFLAMAASGPLANAGLGTAMATWAVAASVPLAAAGLGATVLFATTGLGWVRTLGTARATLAVAASVRLDLVKLMKRAVGLGKCDNGVC